MKFTEDMYGAEIIFKKGGSIYTGQLAEKQTIEEKHGSEYIAVMSNAPGLGNMPLYPGCKYRYYYCYYLKEVVEGNWDNSNPIQIISINISSKDYIPFL